MEFALRTKVQAHECTYTGHAAAESRPEASDQWHAREDDELEDDDRESKNVRYLAHPEALPHNMDDDRNGGLGDGGDSLNGMLGLVVIMVVAMVAMVAVVAMATARRTVSHPEASREHEIRHGRDGQGDTGETGPLAHPIRTQRTGCAQHIT